MHLCLVSRQAHAQACIYHQSQVLSLPLKNPQVLVVLFSLHHPGVGVNHVFITPKGEYRSLDSPYVAYQFHFKFSLACHGTVILVLLLREVGHLYQFHRNLRILCLGQGPALFQIGQGIPDLGAFGLQVKNPAALFFYHMIDCHISSDRHIGHLLLQQLHMPCNILFLRHTCKQRAGIYIPGLYVKGIQDILNNLLLHHVNTEGVDFPPFPDHFQKYFRNTAGGPSDVCVRFLHLVMPQHIVADTASGKYHAVALLLAGINDIHGLPYQLSCI